MYVGPKAIIYLLLGMRLIDIIKENIPLAWDSDMISANSDITIQDMLDNPQFKWNYYAANYKATISDLLKPVPKCRNGKPLWKWDYRILSYKIPADDIMAHKQLGWKWGTVSSNNTLTFEHVLENDDIDWDWQSLCYNCPFRVELYRLYPYRPWSFRRLSWNRGLHIDDVLANLDLIWDWSAISANTTVTIDHVLKHHNLPWRWDRLSVNIPLRDIFKYAGLPWNWNFVVHNSKFSFDDFIRNSHEKIVLTCNTHFFMELNIDRIRYIYNNNLFDNISDMRTYSLFYNRNEIDKYVSWYSNITMKDVLENKDIPWNKYNLAMNSNIPPRDIILAHDFFDIDSLKNIFNHHKLTVDDILALKGILPENIFLHEVQTYRFHSDNITISDIVRTRDLLSWNWNNFPHDLRV